MSIVNYQDLKNKVIGSKVSKPLSGTLSGHAAGEPFDKHVYAELKKEFPQQTFRQYEYLNDLYSKNPKVITFQERLNLFNSPTVMFLLSRGKQATSKWDLENIFEEKQNDTADILVVKNDFYEIIDIKTRNTSKKSQPPNIISAYKLAQTCAKMLDNKEYDSFSICYFGIDWKLEGNFLVCIDAHSVNLFKSNPQDLYINWAAAMQIQFQVDNLEQNFEGNQEEWARQYLKHFITQAKRRAENMIEKFVKPFEKYV
ncbi:Restriction endonuclease HincII [Bernardetia litoralis DSM 6794]|uniref:Restriction endonuclease HincII n=1 Tax=Bernardetia litoralis (strain ATCC 23117 / DSM 6794 / NBRC 15988 / NCIMB 1366 / Fx l1 / Sio-4) TaxID=880071 RepID=I4AID7_BERLS|nr:HincII family type II restriction endonuclease [Bernardetia litoralis]AFM03722.1 Restriction endonuclease HincII [Bernardetia litoralis DSM 6794]